MFVNADACDRSWELLTYYDIREIAQKDGSILILPIGSIEQHGYHLPVATDTILSTEIAHLGANRVSDDLPIIVGPSVWSGYSPHHFHFGGTLSLQFRHLLSVLEDLADSGLQNGFDAVLLLNGHGGNAAIIDGAVSTIGTAHPDVDITGLAYFRLAEPFIDDIRESDIGGMAHGGEFETSLMLYLHENLVQTERKGTYLDEPYELGGQDLLEGGSLSVYRGFEEYSASGAIGDPTLASAEKGETLFQRLGDELEQLLREIHNQNRIE